MSCAVVHACSRTRPTCARLPNVCLYACLAAPVASSVINMPLFTFMCLCVCARAPSRPHIMCARTSLYVNHASVSRNKANYVRNWSCSSPCFRHVWRSPRRATPSTQTPRLRPRCVYHATRAVPCIHLHLILQMGIMVGVEFRTCSQRLLRMCGCLFVCVCDLCKLFMCTCMCVYSDSDMYVRIF
jgi:hypothetical protein